MRGGLLLLLSLAIGTAPAVAQASVPGPLPSSLWNRPAPGPLRSTLAPADSVPRNIPPTYWKEGALIGGLTGAVALAVLVTAFCEDSETADSCGGTTVGGALVGAVLLGVPGALIGGQFPKGRSADSLPE